MGGFQTMRSKRFIAMAMVSMMALSMTACGGKTEEPATTEPAADAPAETPDAEPAADAAEDTADAAADAAGAGGNIGVCIYKFDDAFMTTYPN